MATLTVTEAIARFGVEIDEHLDRDAAIPMNAGLQRQGDVILVPTTETPVNATPVPSTGVAVVRGENGGNTHLLLAQGQVDYVTLDRGLDIGCFTVTEEAQAFLAHPEHGYLGIAPGTYLVRRQREQADEIRMVAD